MRNLVRHTFAAIACLLFVFLWLTAGNQDALSPWIEALTRPASCTANPTACAHQQPGGAAVASVSRSSEPVADGWRAQRPRQGS